MTLSLGLASEERDSSHNRGPLSLRRPQLSRGPQSRQQRQTQEPLGEMSDRGSREESFLVRGSGQAPHRVRDRDREQDRPRVTYWDRMPRIRRVFIPTLGLPLRAIMSSSFPRSVGGPLSQPGAEQSCLAQTTRLAVGLQGPMVSGRAPRQSTAPSFLGWSRLSGSELLI